jgi:stage III sporulation protein AG
MDIKATFGKIKELITKYRYALLVLLIGLLLMFFPNKEKNASTKVEHKQQTSTITETIEKRLATILSHVSGAGDVEVIITISEGEEIVYQTDDNNSNTNDSVSSNISTVLVTDSERNQTGLIRQINPEIYQGAIILCTGADDPVVRYSIVDAVSKVTGLGANRISVLKRK